MQIKTRYKKIYIALITLLIVILCIGELFMLISTMLLHKENNIYPFSEKLIGINTGWLLTDSSGNSEEITLPCKIEYGTDGIYTLSTIIPEGLDTIDSPILMIYSNYTDITVILSGEEIYSFPFDKPAYSGATGNTWHMIRMNEYKGKTLEINIKCQLGDGLTYKLLVPEIGSKATAFYKAINNSIVSILTSAVMIIISIIIIGIFFLMKRKLEFNSSILYLAAFSVIFAIYIFLECDYAKILGPNGYAVYIATFITLAMIPGLLAGFFRAEVGKKYIRVVDLLIGVCFANVFMQTVLQYTGVANMRHMLPFTHAIIFATIIIIPVFILQTNPREKPESRVKLLSALPMLAGGCADILLFWNGKPSANNSMWFHIGIAVFIVFQLAIFVNTYFGMYCLKIENEFLREMAYCDVLTGISNRNAYELHLRDLSMRDEMPDLSCIIIDINRLKQINDKYGHTSGDKAIIETGKILQKLTPDNGCCYRIGGDEFVIIIENTDENSIKKLIEDAQRMAAEKGRELSLPLSLAASGGRYNQEDNSLRDFIRRIDADMYSVKRRMERALD